MAMSKLSSTKYEVTMNDQKITCAAERENELTKGARNDVARAHGVWHPQRVDLVLVALDRVVEFVESRRFEARPSGCVEGRTPNATQYFAN